MPALNDLVSYLEASGWRRDDEDAVTSLWRCDLSEIGGQPPVIVLPVDPGVTDLPDRLHDAVSLLAWLERRTEAEVVTDVVTGGVDVVSVRTRPDAPSGEATLGFVKRVMPALRDLVVGAASASVLGDATPVLPNRRPLRAENYTDSVRLTTSPGSFVLTLFMPLREDPQDLPDEEPAGDRPFGRVVQQRIQDVAARAVGLAAAVVSGEERLEAFAQLPSPVGNATELGALGALGGPGYAPYDLRFSPSPTVGPRASHELLTVSPGQQRILAEASDYLRTRQPRRDVVVTGLVVSLRRADHRGPGEVVVQGVDDDAGVQRRFAVDLAEHDYRRAARAHVAGYPVTVVGDVDPRGARRRVVRVQEFSVLPGPDEG